MKLATTTLDFSQYVNTQEDAILHIKNAGFKNIDYSFEMDFVKNIGVATANADEYLKKLKFFAEENGVELVQSHAPMGRPLVQDMYYDSFIDANKKCIKACAALGIKNIVIHSGYDTGLSKEETMIKNKEFYYKLLPTAEEYEVNILTENFNKMWDSQTFWIDNAKDMRELIDFVDHPLFHCCWDTGHANMQDMSQDKELKILGKDVYALHIQDNFGDEDHHIAPYFGSLNLDAVMTSLKEIGYKGYFTFESTCMIYPFKRRRTFERDNRLLIPPIEIIDKVENLLYDIGKHILKSYECFDE